MFSRTLLAVTLVLSAASAQAQSSLGIQAGGAELALTATGDDSLYFARGWLDVAITDAHGLQLGVTLEDTPAGALGSLDAHLYLAPQETVKYGFFASASDLDGGSFTLGLIGAEAMLALGPRTTAEVRGGIGLSRRIGAPDQLDFIFAGARLDRQVTPSLELGLAVEIADYDEAGFRAIGSTATVEATWRPGGGALALTAALGRSGLDGRDGAAPETFVRLGLNFSFGAAGTRRPFHRADPYAPLALRGLF